MVIDWWLAIKQLLVKWCWSWRWPRVSSSLEWDTGSDWITGQPWQQHLQLVGTHNLSLRPAEALEKHWECLGLWFYNFGSNNLRLDSTRANLVSLRLGLLCDADGLWWSHCSLGRLPYWYSAYQEPENNCTLHLMGNTRFIALGTTRPHWVWEYLGVCLCLQESTGMILFHSQCRI